MAWRVGFCRAGVLVIAGLLWGCQRPAAAPKGTRLPAPDRPLYTFSEEELGAYLPAVREQVPELPERVVVLGRRNLGQPYEIFLLGEFPFEYYDPDPIYCLARSDCLTFCEHTYAAALAHDWWSYLRILQRLRYRDGIIGMLTRNHYTLADWNRNNGFLFEDLTDRLGGGVSVPLHQVCRRARFFARYGIGQDIPDEPVRDSYIPKDRVPDVLLELRNGDFVNIIRGNEASQYCGHTGLIALAGDGTVNLLHSARPAVREQPLLEYLAGDRRCLGIKILRLRPDAEAVMERTLAVSARATPVDAEALQKALEARWASAPEEAKPMRVDWKRACRLQAYRLDYDTPVDAELQAVLERIDRALGAKYGIPEEDRAAGVLELNDLRLALVRPDRMFYGASVPKICILAAWFEAHPEAAVELSAEVADELGRMIKRSDNELAAKYARQVGLDRLQAFLRSKRYRFYDPDHGGGLWCGKYYGVEAPRVGDPLEDRSHAATVRQCLRFYLMMEQGRLVSWAASEKMKAIFASPHLEHHDSKFVRGLAGREVRILRKSGWWEDWHLDTARVEHGERVYLLAGMVHHPRGDDYLADLAREVDGWLCPASGD